MPSTPGETFQIGYHHPGDRVRYDGREYRATGWGTRTGLVWLVSETSDYPSPGQVHQDHLTLAWCPESHGGTGRPSSTTSTNN
jgi:hypothetical protein